MHVTIHRKKKWHVKKKSEKISINKQICSVLYFLCVRTEPKEKIASASWAPAQSRGSMCRPKRVGQLSNCAENLIKKNTLSVCTGQLSEEWREVISQIIQTNIFYQLFTLRIKKFFI